MKPNRCKKKAARRHGSVTRVLGLATLLLYALVATVAQAATQLLGDTTLVTGSESAVYSFNAPAAGTVTVQLSNLNWPQALSSLSFMTATPSNVLSPLTHSTSTVQSLAFQVAAGGTYFADVMAVAGGPLDLGAYSLSVSFTPVAPVPLPSSGALLLGVVASLIGLSLRRATRAPAVMPAAAHSAP